MEVSARRAYNLMKELGYERVSCSEEEKKTAERLLQVAKELNVDAHIEEFSVPCGRVHGAKLVVTEPYAKEYEVTGYERSLSTPEGGLDLDFYYAEDLMPANLVHVKGKIVLVNGYLRRPMYKKLREAGAAALISWSGTTLDRKSETDITIRKLRESMTEPFGFMPAVNLRAADAAEIVRRGAKRMHLELNSECYEGTSRNVCAVIPGTQFPDEIISFGAHYDSVYFSTGVYDNMSGSVILTEIMRYFAANPPARTLKFNWYGSEEQGLLGSKAWTKAHEDELKKHLLMINVDVAAATLGHNMTPILATEKAVAYVDGLMREMGVASKVHLDTYSSDCIPFADHGVPAVNFCRFGVQGANYIHDRRDNFASNYIDEKSLDITLQQVLFFARRVVNTPIFPIDRVICDEIRDKVDVYLFRKEKTEDK